ncbi:MAG: hypothetical protein DYG93_04760 [Leptolyngbya sp. PLA2]|nr:hypothetical protein [Leptolyngbya sp. PL-A2]
MTSQRRRFMFTVLGQATLQLVTVLTTSSKRVGERKSLARPERFQRGSTRWKAATCDSSSSSRNMRAIWRRASARSGGASARSARTRSGSPGRQAWPCEMTTVVGPPERSRARRSVRAFASQWFGARRK